MKCLAFPTVGWSFNTTRILNQILLGEIWNSSCIGIDFYKTIGANSTTLRLYICIIAVLSTAPCDPPLLLVRIAANQNRPSVNIILNKLQIQSPTFGAKLPKMATTPLKSCPGIQSPPSSLPVFIRNKRLSKGLKITTLRCTLKYFCYAVDANNFFIILHIVWNKFVWTALHLRIRY